MSAIHAQAAYRQPASSFAQIAGAFPKRRMKILATGKQSVSMAVMLAAIMGILTIVIVYFVTPDLLYDYKVSKDPVIDTQTEIHGSCKTRKFVFVDCDMQIRYKVNPEDRAIKEVHHNIWFVSFDPPTTTDAVRYGKDPSMITTTVALDHLTNRIVMMAGFTLMFGILSIGGVYSAWKSYRFGRTISDKLNLQPVLANIKNIQNERNVSFETHIDGVKKKGHNILRKKDVPLFLSPQGDTALGVEVPGTAHVILLDEKLTVLDFTEQERVALRAAIIF
ncbi:hypothetical protein [Undibacterium sp. TJN19]|uniref:hypothetical protein n=1 Tax=Undibacterium sp. TJN19 TaxID=3413055 RepID=UPI003BF3F606